MPQGKLLEMSEEFRTKLKAKNEYNSNDKYSMEHTSTLSHEDNHNRHDLKGKNEYNSNNQYGHSE